MIILIIHIIVSYDQNISLIFYVNDGSHVRLRHPSCVYINAQRQYTAVLKMCTLLKWLSLPYILGPSYVLLQFSSIWCIAQWNIVVQIVPLPEIFYILLWNPLKHQTTPLIIEVHFDPYKYEFADCTILGDFAYISYPCLFIYLCLYPLKHLESTLVLLWLCLVQVWQFKTIYQQVFSLSAKIKKYKSSPGS